MLIGGKTGGVTNSLALICIPQKESFCTHSVEILFRLNNALLHLVSILLQLVNQGRQISVSWSEVK